MHVFFNGESYSCDMPLTVADLLARHQIATERVAVEVNLELVPREQHAQFTLQDGDRVEVVTLVGGG